MSLRLINKALSCPNLKVSGLFKENTIGQKFDKRHICPLALKYIYLFACEISLVLLDHLFNHLTANASCLTRG